MSTATTAGISETILIVDDDCDTRVLLRDCLEFAGFDVTEAASGVEAVESAVEGSARRGPECPATRGRAHA